MIVYLILIIPQLVTNLERMLNVYSLNCMRPTSNVHTIQTLDPYKYTLYSGKAQGFRQLDKSDLRSFQNLYSVQLAYVLLE